MKKLVSFVLTVIMALNMVTVALAANVATDIKPVEVMKGETVTVTLTLDETVTKVESFEYDVYFNDDVFELVSAANGTAHAKMGVSEKLTNVNGDFYMISVVNEGMTGLTIEKGVVYTLVFKAKESITEKEDAMFKTVCAGIYGESFTEIVSPEEADEIVGTKVTVNVPCTHNWVEVEDAKYLKSAANCGNPAVYWKSCEICEVASTTETFTVGTPVGDHNIGKDGYCTVCGFGDEEMLNLLKVKAAITTGVAAIEATEDTANTEEAVEALLKAVVDAAVKDTRVAATVALKNFVPAGNGDDGEAVYTVTLTLNNQTVTFDVTIVIVANEVEEEKTNRMIFPKLFNVKVECGEGGSVNTSETFKMAYGSTRTIKITADEGYEVADVIVNGKSVGAVEKYTIKGARTTYTVKVLFEEIDG